MRRSLRMLTEDVEELKNELSELKIGDNFKFGNYHGPIEWRVLDKTQDTLFVISEYALDTKPFDKDGKTNDWNICSLKKWLNSEFFNQVFDSEEKSLIENNAFGKIFCLNIHEATKYFLSNSDRRCKPTQYAKSQGAETQRDFVCWWLRSCNYCDGSAVHVDFNGDIDNYYNYVLNASGSVRPAYISVRPVMRLRI